MRFLLDENVPRGLARLLQAVGHDVRVVGEAGDTGASDQDVLAAAWREERVLITADRGFGHLVVRKRLAHRGVLYLRLREAGPQELLAAVETALHELGAEVQETFSVLTPRGLRRH